MSGSLTGAFRPAFAIVLCAALAACGGGTKFRPVSDTPVRVGAPYKVRGVFRVGFNVEAGIDGTAETDGLDVTSKNLGGAYVRGMLVIQDGYKHLPDGHQNFKYLPWAQVAEAMS